MFGPRSTPTYKREAYRTNNTGGAVYKCAGVVSQTDCPEGDAVGLLRRGARGAEERHLHRLAGSHHPPGLAGQPPARASRGGNDRKQFAVSGNLLKQIGITLSQDYDRKRCA